MNDLLFYALLIALIYYFLLYLPRQKPALPTPLTHQQSTQTDPLPSATEPELEQVIDNLISNIKQLNQQIN